MSKKNKLMILIVFISLSLIIIGVTYAYFTAGTSGGESESTINTTAGKLTIVYADNDPNIILNDIFPRDEEWATKDFTITGSNNTDLSMNYAIYLVVDNNTFSSDALSYSLEGVNTSNTGNVAENSNGFINNNNVFLGLGEFTESGSNMVHTYTLKIYFKNSNTNQNVDQSKTFACHINIDNGDNNVLSASNIGRKVNFVSKYSNDLIWRLFYADDDYVYLISSKNKVVNEETVEAEAQRTNYGGLGGVGLISQESSRYTGTVDITDPFLRSLNSLYFEYLNGNEGTFDTDKALAWFYDQNVWKNWKDNQGKATYAIGGPSVELLAKSFNKTSAINGTQEIVPSVVDYGYVATNSNGTLLNSYNHGIYHLKGSEETFWLTSPGGDHVGYEANIGKTIRTSGGNSSYGTINSIYFGWPNYNLGLRPVVIIPTSTYMDSDYMFLD